MNVNDVMIASEGSAAQITNAVATFGNGDLGEGLRKVANVAFTLGTQEGYKIGMEDSIPYAYFHGFNDGKQQGIITSICCTSILGISLYFHHKYKDSIKNGSQTKED